LLRNAALFRLSSAKVGQTSNIKHKIDTGDHKPVYIPMRRMSPDQHEVVRQHVEEMQKDDIISPTTSPWAAPVVLVKKKDGSYRFCIDYRALNKITKRDVYPLPRIDDALDSLGSAKFFTTLDLPSGFWQVPMDEADREKTAFITRFGQFMFNRMPFGLTNAPATFQRLMDAVLTGLTWKLCLVYIDDIIIFSPSFNQHLSDLQEVFDRLRNANLSIKLSKCRFCSPEVEYLGHIVTKDGVRTDPKKVDAVAKMAAPENTDDIKSFLGMVNYYRRFIRRAAHLAEPLQRLTRDGVPFVWDNECQTAFEELKRALTESPVLAFPDFTREFILQTDASNYQSGAVLSQIIEGEERPIAYFSQTLNAAQRNYSPTQRECLAIVQALRHFKPYLVGRKFTIFTDHAPLQYLYSKKDTNAKLMRWYMEISEYNVDVRYRPGKENANADAVSRLQVFMLRASSTPKNRIAVPDADRVLPDDLDFNERPSIYTLVPSKPIHFSEQTVPFVSDFELLAEKDFLTLNGLQSRHLVFAVSDSSPWSNISELQSQDSEFAPIIKFLKSNELPDDLALARRVVASASNYLLDDNVLYHLWFPNNRHRRSEARRQLALPQSLRDEVLRTYHDDSLGAHLGAERTLHRIQSRFYWDTMVKDIEFYVRSCKVCNERKSPKRAPAGEMGSVARTATEPFQIVAVDILGPLPETKKGNKYIVVFSDYFTKWPEAFAVTAVDAKKFAELFVEEIVCRYGAPETLLSDQGSQFRANLSKAIYEALQVRKVSTSPYHPQTDGMVERFNATLEDMLSAYVSKHQNDWDVYIPYVLFAYRASLHPSIGDTPFYMMFGRDARYPAEIKNQVLNRPSSTNPADHRHELTVRLQEAKEVASASLQKAFEKHKKYYDRHRRVAEFRPGDLVWLYQPEAPTVTPKFRRPWEGPFRIQEKKNAQNYKLTDIGTRRFSAVVHVSRLKLFTDPQDRPTNPPPEFASPQQGNAASAPQGAPVAAPGSSEQGNSSGSVPAVPVAQPSSAAPAPASPPSPPVAESSVGSTGTGSSAVPPPSSSSTSSPSTSPSSSSASSSSTSPSSSSSTTVEYYAPSNIILPSEASATAPPVPETSPKAPSAPTSSSLSTTQAQDQFEFVPEDLKIVLYNLCDISQALKSSSIDAEQLTGVSALQRQLRLLLGRGSPFIKSNRQADYFTSKISQLTSRADVSRMIDLLLNDFNHEFKYEIARLYR
jgi:hypothetical protein